MKNKIENIDALKAEIKLLNQQKESIEKELDGNWTYVREHFPTMLRNTIFKKASERIQKGWAQTLISIPKVQEAVGNAAEKLTHKLEDALLKWFDKTFINKKD